MRYGCILLWTSPPPAGVVGAGGGEHAVASQATHGFMSATDKIKLDGIPPNPAPVGAVLSFAGAAAPSGWLLCYGQPVSRSTYAALFAMIGTIYGVGDGSTTFNIPDLRGRVPIGADNMGGISANRVTASQADSLGRGAGEETHMLSISEIPSHYHGIRHSMGNLDSELTTGTGPAGWDNYDYGSYARVNKNGNPLTEPIGGSLVHNNMPPYITLNTIIKY